MKPLLRWIMLAATLLCVVGWVLRGEFGLVVSYACIALYVWMNIQAETRK